MEFDGRLLWWGIDVCTAGDDFATVQYRWGTMAADVGSDHYQERIVSLGNIQRGLGNDHLPVASTLEVQLDNTDFAMDLFLAAATVESTVFKARFKVLCGVADSTGTIVTKTIGVFVCLDFPAGNSSTIQLSLADDSLGKLTDLLVAPTLQDWLDEHNTTYDVFDGGVDVGEYKWLTDPSVPVPLQFGSGPWVGAPVSIWNSIPTTADFDVGTWVAGDRKFLFPIIVLATRDDVAVTAGDVSTLRGVFRDDVVIGPMVGAGDVSKFRGQTTFPIPKTFVDYSNNTKTTRRIWEHYKTPTITKDGYDWKLLWIAFHAQNYALWFKATNFRQISGFNGSTPMSVRVDAPVRFGDASYQGYGRDEFAAFDHFLVSGGRPGSGINGKAIDTYRNPANICMDLVEYYSSMGAAGVDTTRFVRARNASRANVRGAIASGGGAYENTTTQQLNTDVGPYGIGVLRRSLAEIVRSTDMDLFVTMEGQAALVVMAADFETQTTTYPTVDEARTNDVVVRTPSAGERWAPYNRVFLKCADGVARGPFDDEAAISSWGRVIAKALESKWWDSKLTTSESWGSSGDLQTVRNERFLEAKARPIVSFTTDVGMLVHELGDYFHLTVSRGGQNTLFDNTLWRLEAVNISPEKGSVEVVAVAMADLVTGASPFLLDNEALLVRVAGAGGRTCTVTDGSNNVVFSSGDLTADAVADGDILLIRDSSEAATTFFRNRQIQIKTTNSATDLTLDASADLDFGTAGAHVIADTDWVILRSYVTYPTAVTDPANYPSGGDMYGKISNSVGEFSTGDAANQLLDG